MEFCSHLPAEERKPEDYAMSMKTWELEQGYWIGRKVFSGVGWGYNRTCVKWKQKERILETARFKQGYGWRDKGLPKLRFYRKDLSPYKLVNFFKYFRKESSKIEVLCMGEQCDPRNQRSLNENSSARHELLPCGAITERTVPTQPETNKCKEAAPLPSRLISHLNFLLGFLTCWSHASLFLSL